MEAHMKTRKLYQDGIEEEITGPIKDTVTSDGHVVRSYRLADGKRRYFVTLAETFWCAHGKTIAEAIADALWKNPANRPPLDQLVKSIQKEGKARKINLNEFRLLTGACLTGCRDALSQAKRDESPLTAHEIRDFISREWGNKLLSILGWEETK